MIEKRRASLLSQIYDQEAMQVFVGNYKKHVQSLANKDKIYRFIGQHDFVVGQKILLNSKVVLKFDYFFIDENKICKDKILDVIHGAKEYFSIQKIEVAIQLSGDQINEVKILKDLNFIPFAITGLGRTKDIEKFSMDLPNYSIAMAKECDLDKIYEIEQLAYSRLQNSKIDFTDPSTKKMIENLYQRMIQDQSAFFLVNEVGIKIGVAGVLPNFAFNTGFIASVSLLPDFQNKELSRKIYYKIRELFLQHNIPYYRSTTANSAILSIANKMDRTITDYTMVHPIGF